MSLKKIKEKYYLLLKEHFIQRDEKKLFDVSELGRDLVRTKIPPEEIGELHENAIQRLGEEFPDVKLLEIVRMISEPLMELLMSYGLAFRELLVERRQAEEKLRESEEKYRGIFNESVVVIYLFDAQKNFIDSNQAGLNLLGYSREELLKMNIAQVDADTNAVLPAHKQLLAGDRIVNYEHELKRKDGSIITVLNNSRPLTDISGNVVGMQTTLIDITGRKKMAEELIKRNKELETFNNITVGRELRLIELKKEINELLEESGEKPRYEIPVKGLDYSGE